MGAGNGTLMMNILDYIQKYEPSVYKRTQYNIIEISGKLAERQSERQEVRDVTEQHTNVKIINKSIFDWDIHVPDECFFLGMEVIVSSKEPPPLREREREGKHCTEPRGFFLGRTTLHMT